MNKEALDILEHLLNQNHKLEKDNFELMNRIDKAIAYIKEECFINSLNRFTYFGDPLSPKYLVSILRGEDNESN